MTTTQFKKSYWDYFLELEEQFANTQKYVAFDEINKKTFSIEYLKLIQAVCSEIDVVAKEIAVFFNPAFEKESNPNIQKWGYIIQSKLPDLLSSQVTFNGETVIAPWKLFGYEQYKNEKGNLCYRLKKGCKKPSWWDDYNKIKHRRTSKDINGNENYMRANLNNMILCYSALFSLEILFMEYLIANGGLDYGIFNSKLFSFDRPYIDNDVIATR